MKTPVCRQAARLNSIVHAGKYENTRKSVPTSVFVGRNRINASAAAEDICFFPGVNLPIQSCADPAHTIIIHYSFFTIHYSLNSILSGWTIWCIIIPVHDFYRLNRKEV